MRADKAATPAATSAAGFRASQSGGVLVLAALVLPVLTGLSAVAIDYASLVKRRAELQRAADSGGIAGVNPFKLANADDAAAIRTAKERRRATHLRLALPPSRDPSAGTVAPTATATARAKP